MKKQFIYAMAAVALVAGMASCAKDASENGGKPVVQGEETYVQVSVSTGMGTRAENDDNATLGEVAVKTVNVFCYDINGNAITAAAVPDTQATKDLVAGNLTYTVKIKTTTATKLVYAGINLNTEAVNDFKLSTNMLNSSELVLAPATNAAAGAAILAKYGASANGFAMFGDELRSVSLTATTGDDIPAGNKITGYKVSRILTKVVVTTPEANNAVSAADPIPVKVGGVTVGNVTRLDYRVRNVNKSTFHYPHKNTAGTTLVDRNYYASQWLAGGGAGKYGTADFFDYTTTFKGVVKSLGTTGAGYTHPASEAKAAVDAASISYILENTDEQHLQGNSSYAVIKAVYEPATFMHSDNNWGNAPSARVSAGKDFFVFRVKNGAVVNVFFFETLADAQAYIDYTYSDAKGYDLATRNSAKRFIDRYIAGVCYYYAWLGKSSTPQYDVLRNQFIEVRVKSFTGLGRSSWTDTDNDGVDDDGPTTPGDPKDPNGPNDGGEQGEENPQDPGNPWEPGTPNDPTDPEDPDEPITTDANIQLEIVINPWTKVVDEWDF